MGLAVCLFVEHGSEKTDAYKIEGRNVAEGQTPTGLFKELYGKNRR